MAAKKATKIKKQPAPRLTPPDVNRLNAAQTKLRDAIASDPRPIEEIRWAKS